MIDVVLATAASAIFAGAVSEMVGAASEMIDEDRSDWSPRPATVRATLMLDGRISGTASASVVRAAVGFVVHGGPMPPRWFFTRRGAHGELVLRITQHEGRLIAYRFTSIGGLINVSVGDDPARYGRVGTRAD